jgi:hypothetical protein
LFGVQSCVEGIANLAVCIVYLASSSPAKIFWIGYRAGRTVTDNWNTGCCLQSAKGEGSFVC